MTSSTRIFTSDISTRPIPQIHHWRVALRANGKSRLFNGHFCGNRVNAVQRIAYKARIFSLFKSLPRFLGVYVRGNR
jgi:hypothetical protein